jgi:heme oxygenase
MNQYDSTSGERLSMSHSVRRFQLKEATSRSHDAVDRAVGSFEDRASYEAYLKATYAFRVPLERQLAAVDWSNGFEDWRPRFLEPLIRADLADLNLSIDQDTMGSTSDEESGPPGGDPSTLFGTLYVLEGSTLGAQVLFRRAASLGLTGEFGARHLAGQSAGVSNWRRFLDLLENAKPISIDRAAAASNRAFGHAERAFRAFRDAD